MERRISETTPDPFPLGFAANGITIHRLCRFASFSKTGYNHNGDSMKHFTRHLSLAAVVLAGAFFWAAMRSLKPFNCRRFIFSR